MPSVNDMTTTAPALLPGVLKRLGRDTQYVLLGFPLGLIALPLGLAGFGVGVGTAIIWIGLPILIGTLLLARGFATIERVRVSAVLGRRLPHAHYKRATGQSFWRRLLTPITDAQSWLDLAHTVFRFIPSTIAFAFVIAWWSAA